MAETITVAAPRCVCGKRRTFELDAEKVARWRRGEFVQDVFPELSDDDREALVSGCCPECWERMFADEAGEPCVDCDGTGHSPYRDGDLCPRCGGVGAL